MPHSLVSPRPPTAICQMPFYPADLLPQLQNVLGALADIDGRYATERDNIEKGAGSRDAKQRLLEELTSRHEADREPYVRQLSKVQRQIATLLRRA